jgi:hypothetical protein
MGRKTAAKAKGLTHKLCTRVNDEKFQELNDLLLKNPTLDMSRLLRHILHNRPVRVFTRDLTLDNLMEDLARLRTEIRAIGVNINQITKAFHTYPELNRKEFFASRAFGRYDDLQPRIELLLQIISKLATKWL